MTFTRNCQCSSEYFIEKGCDNRHHWDDILTDREYRFAEMNGCGGFGCMSDRIEAYRNTKKEKGAILFTLKSDGTQTTIDQYYDGKVGMTPPLLSSLAEIIFLK